MINQFQTVEDFISDESFQNYVLKRDASAVKRWKAYENYHPEHQELIKEASKFVHLLAPQDTVLTLAPKSNKKKILYISGIAVCVVVLFSIWFFSLSAKGNKYVKVIKKAETENLSMIFPDQTVVDLRKGSRIEYFEDWTGEANRKVWLEGEAFFNVKPDSKSATNFIVNLDQGQIRVLGTKFLVRSIQDDISIVLEEGKIECLVKDQQIKMNPGDFLISNHEKVSVEHDRHARTFDSWRSGKLAFKNVAIEEVIETINNSYPMKVSLGNRHLENRKITATVDRNDPMLLLKAIAAIYDIELIENNNTVILK